MIELSVFMDSSVTEVLAFKCCSLPDQNLEIHLRNTGAVPVVLSGFFTLEDGSPPTNIAHLYPPGDITVLPGEVTAVYCSMDPAEWARYRTIAFFETTGRAHRAPTSPPDGPA